MSFSRPNEGAYNAPDNITEFGGEACDENRKRREKVQGTCITSSKSSRGDKIIKGAASYETNKAFN